MTNSHLIGNPAQDGANAAKEEDRMITLMGADAFAALCATCTTEAEVAEKFAAWEAGEMAKGLKDDTAEAVFLAETANQQIAEFIQAAKKSPVSEAKYELLQVVAVALDELVHAEMIEAETAKYAKQ